MSESKKRARVIQLLCPSRHAILALVYESPNGEPDPDILARFKSDWNSINATRAVNPWCGLCGSRELEFEDQPTFYTDKDEAFRVAKSISVENLASRIHLDAVKKARDN